MTDATVYAVASGKGGVGKTTTAVNLGAGFADAGRSVVVVDLDLGMANLGDFVEATPAGPSLHEVLAGQATLDDALSHVGPNYDAILGSEDLELFGQADPRGVRELLSDLRDRYDVVILDSGGGLSHDTALPLGLADDVILVSTVEKPAVKNTAKTLDLADKLDGSIAGIVLTRVGGGKDEVDPTEIANRLELTLLGTVPEDSTVPASAAAGEPLLHFDRDCPAAQAYLEIAYDLLDESLPMGFGDAAEGPDVDVAEREAQAAESGEEAAQAPGSPAAEEEGESVAEDAAEAGVSFEEETEESPETEGAGTEPTEEEPADEEAATEAAEGGNGGGTAQEEPAEESRSFLSKITGGLIG